VPSGGDVEKAEAYFVDSIEAWTKEMDLDKFTILGHSFGGYLSACYALKHPEKVERLVLADPWGIPRPPPSSTGIRKSFRWRLVAAVFSTFNPLSVLRAAGPYGPSLIPRFRADLLNLWRNHGFDDHVSVVGDYIYHLNAQRPAGESVFSMLNGTVGWAKQPLIDRLPALPEKMPVMFLYGENSWMDVNAAIELQQTTMQKHRVTIRQVPSSGHHIYVHNAPFFNKNVLQFTSLRS